MKNIKFVKFPQVGDRIKVLPTHKVGWCDASCRAGETGKIIEIYPSDFYNEQKLKEKVMLVVDFRESSTMTHWHIPQDCVELL